MFTGNQLRTWKTSFENSDPAWIAGAKAGLRLAANRETWEWNSFIEDIESMSEQLGGVEPVEPGCKHGEYSIYDVLGGYTSSSGAIHPEGLYIRAPIENCEELLRALSGIEIHVLPGRLLVPRTAFPSLLKLIGLRGPLASEVER